MSLTTLIFQGIPEMIAIAALGFAIAKIPLVWKEIILSGCAMAVVAYLIRLLPITFGVHTIALIFILMFCIFKFGKTTLSTAVISGLLSFFTLVIIETVIALVIFRAFHVSPEQVSQSDTLMIVSGIPQVILIFMTCYLVTLYNKRKMK